MSGILGVSPNMKSGVLGKHPAGHVVQVVYNVLTSGWDHVTTSAVQALADWLVERFPH